MPNLLAHTLVVKRFYNRECEMGDAKEKDSILQGNYDFLVLGSLGPDPMFYVGIVPFHGLHIPTALKKIGNKIHKTDGKELFKSLIECVYVIDNDKEKKRFECYILGLLAHYFLDREAHPYILYKSGFDANGRITSHYHFEHAYYESNIDCSLAIKYSISHFVSNPDETIPENKRDLELIDSKLVPALEEMFNCHLPKNFYSNSIRNMKSLLKWMNHNGNFKAKLLGKRISLSAMYQPKEPDFSSLNEEKNCWLDPCSGIKHNESFLELHSRAYELLDSCYKDICKNGFNYSVINKYLDGKDFYGALPNQKRMYKEVN